MKLVKPSYEILEQPSGIDGIYKQIEIAGRTCYRSYDKITEDSAKKFVDMLTARGHTAMLEHGTIYLVFENLRQKIGHLTIHKYMSNPYSKVNIEKNRFKGFTYYITTNYRVLYENDWLNDLKYLCEPTEYHEKRVTVKFTSNIHFYKDITRHRLMSYAIESTRYCNYSKGKFDSELTFIIPQWVDLEEGRYGTGHDFMGGSFIHHLDSDIRIFPKTKEGHGVLNFIQGLKNDEYRYLKAIELEWKPEQAAELLPQATKADIVMTGFVSDWDYIFNLRARGKFTDSKGREYISIPHPEVLRLMKPLEKEFYNKGLI